MANKSEREQFRNDAAAKSVTNVDKFVEIQNNVAIITDMLSLVTAQLRVVSGDGTESDLLAVKQKSLGLHSKLEEFGAKFQKDVGLEKIETKEVETDPADLTDKTSQRQDRGRLDSDRTSRV